MVQVRIVKPLVSYLDGKLPGCFYHTLAGAQGRMQHWSSESEAAMVQIVTVAAMALPPQGPPWKMPGNCLAAPRLSCWLPVPFEAFLFKDHLARTGKVF